MAETLKTLASRIDAIEQKANRADLDIQKLYQRTDDASNSIARIRTDESQYRSQVGEKLRILSHEQKLDIRIGTATERAHIIAYLRKEMGGYSRIADEIEKGLHLPPEER